MYSTCLFCDKPFGANEALAELPVGRRIAFDAAKGRLWVVCRPCGRWNLVPLEDRWEAIEAAERAYRETTLRTATDNIGLARLREGLELVRIGAPLRPEFAAWRYGDQFGRRRRRALIYSVGGAAAVGTLVVGGVVAGVATVSLLNLITGPVNIYNAWQAKRATLEFTLQDGASIKVRGWDYRGIRFLKDPDGLAIEVPTRKTMMSEETTYERLRGLDAQRLTGLLVPKVNHRGASRSGVDEAVGLLEQVGGPTAFLREIHTNPLRWRGGPLLGDDGALSSMPTPFRLALEMSLHEDAERAALEGELSMLTIAWKEADRIAAIADTLTLPAGVEERLDDLRSKP